MLKEDLDKRICDVEDCGNTQTFREFIIESEKEFYLKHKDLDSLTEEELNSYLDFLDDLWWK